MKVLVIESDTGHVVRDYSNRECAPRVGEFLLVDGDRWVVEEVSWHDHLRQVDLKVRKRP